MAISIPLDNTLRRSIWWTMARENQQFDCVGAHFAKLDRGADRITSVLNAELSIDARGAADRGVTRIAGIDTSNRMADNLGARQSIFLM